MGSFQRALQVSPPLVSGWVANMRPFWLLAMLVLITVQQSAGNWSKRESRSSTR
jgi:hypothetical protein